MLQKQTSVMAPKKALVINILKSFKREDIQAFFKFSHKADLEKILNAKAKPEIISFLQDSKKGRALLKQLEDLYPLDTPPTFYLANLHQLPNSQDLISLTRLLSMQGREHGMHSKPDNKIRVVYASREARTLKYEKHRAIEVPLYYEERMEYSESDPNASDFGERKFVYSLEQGFIWILEGHQHAIICCKGFAPVQPILNFGRLHLQFDWALPNLTLEMLQKITVQRQPRSATFSLRDELQAKEHDGDESPVRTITLSDPGLNECDDFRQISHDDHRQQTAGFYSETPQFSFGGMGIARRYARIWTPARTSNRNYLSLATDVISRTESELNHAYKKDLAGFVNFYRDYPVHIGNNRLYGRERDGFDQLTLQILQADKHKIELQLESDLLIKLVQHQKRLHLVTCASLDCPNCGDETLIVCPACHRPLEATFEEDEPVLVCRNKKCNTAIHEADEITCQCGAQIGRLIFANHIHIYPKPELLDALWGFIDKMQDVYWHGKFSINGGILQAASRIPPVTTGEVKLDDLKFWNIRAHFHQPYTIGEQRRKKYIAILNRAREKCKATKYHPTKDDCDKCLKTRLTWKNFKRGGICLPRMFGLPIEMEKKFDGIHTGMEHADIKYVDTFRESGKQARLGIHLKSRSPAAKRPLGHGAESIRGLYTQLVHSAYEASAGKVRFNVLGVSVPNEMNEEVRTSLKRTANLWGFPILILEEDEWVQIADEVEQIVK